MDSSAILAIFFEEDGLDLVLPRLPHALICSVNMTEIVTRLIDRGGSPLSAQAQLAQLALAVADFDRDLAIQAGLLRHATRHKGLSLGDRACLALAMRERLPVMTADRAWCDLDLPIEVVLIR
jgi:PIN domain nuclease of toxin-antitoxin system